MPRIFSAIAIALPLSIVSVAATAAPDAMMVSDCWIRSMPASIPSGGYFKLMNMSDKPIDLTGVATDAFGMSMLHQTQSSGSTSKMIMIDKATVPANGTLEFAPNGYHVMFENARKAIKVGSSIPVVFTFSDGEKLTSQCMVRNAAGQ
jgi:periplasmic copper chaperone A